MSMRSSRAATSVRRAIASHAEPRKATTAANGVAGYSGFDSLIGGISDANGTLDLKALVSDGFWTEDHSWSLQWMRLASDGYLDN